MASSLEAARFKPAVSHDAAELPGADTQAVGEETKPQHSDAPEAEPGKVEQAVAAAAPTSPAEAPLHLLSEKATPDATATAGRGTAKRGRGAAKAGQKGHPRARGPAKRGKQEQADTDPEEDGGNMEGGLQTRRSGRQSKKPRTFAEEFITEHDPESKEEIPGGSPSGDAAEAGDAKVEKEQQPAAKSEPSQDSDEMPLVKAVHTVPIPVEVAGAEEPEEAKSPRTFARKRKLQEAEEGAPEQAAEEEAEAHAGEAKSPKARRGMSEETGQLDSAEEAPKAEAPARPVEPKTPKAKRRRQSDAELSTGQEDAPDQAAVTAGKQAAQKRRRAKTVPAPGKAGRGAAAGRRRTTSREATPEVPVEASGQPAAAEAAPNQAAAGQQAAPIKAAPVSELEHIREGLQKAEEAHEKKLGELRHLDAQVKGYMDHLSRMDLTVEQLSRTGIGKTVRRFSRWPAQREGAVRSSQDSASDPAKALVMKWHNVAGIRHPKAAKPAAASVPARTGEAKQKQAAQPEQAAPKEKAPAQPGPAPAAQAAPHPVSGAPQAVPAPPVKKEEPKVVAIGFTKQELPAPARKSQPLRADANHGTGSAVRDKALGILLQALAPDEALSREEAAQKLEAALYASYANGKAARQPGQPAEPGVTYMRRLKVLWSWLDGSSLHRSPALKRLFLEGKLAAPDLATMNARRVRDLTEPPATSATPHPDSQQDANGTSTGTAPGSAEVPYANEGPQQSTDMDMDIDPPSQGPAVPGLPRQGIAVSALPSQELLAKLQLFCKGSLEPPQSISSHLQGFTELPLEQTVGEIVQHQEAGLRACQAGQASAEQLHGIIAAGRLLERSLGTAVPPAAAKQQAQPLLAPEEAQLQLLPFAQAALAALARASAAPSQPAPGSAPLRTVLPPQAAAAVHATADAALRLSAPSATAQPVNHSSTPGQGQEAIVPNGGTGGHEEGRAPDLAAALPTSPPRTPVLGGAVHSGPAPLAAPTDPLDGAAGDNAFANMHAAPGVRQKGWSEQRPRPTMAFGHDAKHMHGEVAGVLHAQQSSGTGVGRNTHQAADNGAVAAHMSAEHQAAL